MNFKSSDHPITWFRDGYREGTLTIKPPYQRKPVWAAKQKCYLIESILLSLPIPEIYIQRTTSVEGETEYAIVDGQQRIRTVLQFIGVETDPDQEAYNKFALDKLDSSSNWRNLTFAELEEEDKRRFYDYTFAVRYLTTASDDDIRDMFRRLNKYLTPLKPQELRNATYTGPFMKLALRLADEDYWVENPILTRASIRRMGDVEFVSELLIGVMHGPQGGSSRVIDSYYQQYEDYDDEFPDQRRARKLFDNTLDMIESVLTDIKASRWGNKHDFYTLFVTLAMLLRTGHLPKTNVSTLRRALLEFGDEIDRRRADENVRVSKGAVQYVGAIEKGVNDKKRRADRHAALLSVIGTYFRTAEKSSGRRR